MTAMVQEFDISEEDKLRADFYGFLSALLSRPASKELLVQTAGLTGDDSDLGVD